MEHFDTEESSILKGKQNVITVYDEITKNVLTDVDNKFLYPEDLPARCNSPLNKGQEFSLKKIRRKLKNKLSAQESRRKKKEYVENLEKRVRMLDVENDVLRRKVETQHQSIRSLSFQLNKMKPADENEKRIPSCQSKGTQTGICLKCYLQKQASSNTDAKDDFKVQTGKNGRIIVRSELLEEHYTSENNQSEYTELRSILHPYKRPVS